MAKKTSPQEARTEAQTEPVAQLPGQLELPWGDAARVPSTGELAARRTRALLAELELKRAERLRALLEERYSSTS